MGRYSTDKGTMKTKRPLFSESHKNVVESDNAIRETRPVYSRTSVDNRLKNCENAGEQSLPMQLRPGRKYTPVVGLSKKGLETDNKRKHESNDVTNVETTSSTKSSDALLNKQSTFVAKAERDFGIAQSRRKVTTPTLTTSLGEKQPSQSPGISASSDLPSSQTDASISSQNRKKYRSQSTWKTQQPQRTPKFVHWRSIQRYLPKYSRFSQVKSSRRLSLLQRNSIMSLRPGKKYVSVFAKGRKNKEQQQTDCVNCHADTKYGKENCKHSETVQSSHDVLAKNHVSDGACTSKTSMGGTPNNTDTNDTSTLIETTCKPVKRPQNRHPVTGKFLKDASPRYCRYSSPKRRKAKPRSIPGMMLRPNRKYISVFRKTSRSPVHSTADLTTNPDEENWKDISDSGNDLVAPETTSLKVNKPKRKRVKRKCKAGQLSNTSHKLSVESGFVSQFGSGQRLEQTFKLSGQNIKRTAQKGLQNTDMGSSIHTCNECNSRSPVEEQRNFIPPREQKSTESNKPARVPFTKEKCVTKANQAFEESGRRKSAMNTNCIVTTASQETRTSTRNKSGNWQESGSCHQTTCRTETDFAPKALMILRPYTNYRTGMNRPDCTQWFLIQGKRNCGDECKICPKEMQIGNRANESKLDTRQENCRADTSHEVPDEANKFQSIEMPTSSSMSGENDTQICGVHHVNPDVQDKELHSGETVHPNHSSQVLCDYAPKTLMMLRPYSQYQSICGKTQVFHASCNHWLLVQSQQNELSSATNDSPPHQTEFDELANSDAQVKDVNHKLEKEEGDQTLVITQSPEDLTGSQISEDGSKTSHAIIEPQLVAESESVLDKEGHCSELQPCDSITTNSKVEKVDNITTKTVLKECNENERPFECLETSKNTESVNQAFSEYAPKTLMILRPYTAYRSPSKVTSHEHWLLTPTRDSGKVTVEVSHMGEEVHILPISEQSNDEENKLIIECLQTSRKPEVSLSREDCMKLVETVPNLRTIEEMDSAHEDDCREVDSDESFSSGSPVLEFVPSTNEEHGSRSLEVSDYAPKTLMILRPYTAYQSSRSPHHACNSNTGHWLFNHTKDDCRGNVADINNRVISHCLLGKNEPNHHSEKTPGDKTVDSPYIKLTRLHLTKEPQAKISTKTPLAMSRKRRRCRSLFARTPRQITPSKNLAKTPQPSKLVTPLSVDGSGDSSHLQGNSKVQMPSFEIEESASSCFILSGADGEKVSKQKRLHKVCLDIQVRGLSLWQQQTISADCDPKQQSSAAESVSAEKLDVSEKDLSETNPATEETAVWSSEIGDCAVNMPHESSSAERIESPEQHELHPQSEKEPSQPITEDKLNEHVEDSPTSQTSTNKTTNGTAKPKVHKTAISNRQRTAMKLRKKDKHFLFSRLGFKQTKPKAVHFIDGAKRGRKAKTVKVHWKRRQALLKSMEAVSDEPSVDKDISPQDSNSVLDPSEGSSEQATEASKPKYTTSRREKNVKVHWKKRPTLLKSSETAAEPSVYKDICMQDSNSVRDSSKGPNEQATEVNKGQYTTGRRAKTVKVHWKKRQALLKSSETVSAEPSVYKDICPQDSNSVPDSSKGPSQQATEDNKGHYVTGRGLKTVKVHWKRRQALQKSSETVSAEPNVHKDISLEDGNSVLDPSKGSSEQATKDNKGHYVTGRRVKTVKVHWKRRQALLKRSEAVSAKPGVHKDISLQDSYSVLDLSEGSSEQATEASKPEYTTSRRAKSVKVHWKKRQALLKSSETVLAEPSVYKDICPQDSNSVLDPSGGSSEQATEVNKLRYTTGRRTKTVKVHWKRRQALQKSIETVSAEPNVHKDISLEDGNSVLDPSEGSSEQATKDNKGHYVTGRRVKTVKVHWKRRQALLKRSEAVSAKPGVHKDISLQDSNSVLDLPVSEGSSEQATEDNKLHYTTGRRAKTVKVHWKKRQALLKSMEAVSDEPSVDKDISLQDSNSVLDPSEGSSEQATEGTKPECTKTVKVHWKRTVSAEPSIHKDICPQDGESVPDSSKGSGDQASEANKRHYLTGRKAKTVKVHWKRRWALLKSSETVSAEPSVDEDICSQDRESVPEQNNGSSEQAIDTRKPEYTTRTLKENTSVALPNYILNLIQPRKRGRPKKTRQKIAKKVNPGGCASTSLKNIHPESKQISDKSSPRDDINLCREGSNQTDGKQNICSTDSQGLLPDESVRLQNYKRSSNEDVFPRNYPLPPKKRYRPEKCDEKTSENLSLSDSVLSCGSTVFKEPRRHSDDNLSPRKALLSPRKSSRLAKYKKRTYRNFSYKDLLSYKRSVPKTSQTNTDSKTVTRNNIFPPHKRIRLAKYKHRLYRHSNFRIDGACAGPQKLEARSNRIRNLNQRSCSWPPRKRGRPKSVRQNDGENSTQKDRPSSCDTFKDDSISDVSFSPRALGLTPHKRGRPRRSETAKSEDTCRIPSCDSVDEKGETISEVASSLRTCSLPPRERGGPKRIENAKPEDTCRLPSCDSFQEKSPAIGDNNSSPKGSSLPPRKGGKSRRSETAKLEDTCRSPSCESLEHASSPRTCSLPPRKRGRPKRIANAKQDDKCRPPSCNNVEERSPIVGDANSSPRICSLSPRKRGRSKRIENAKPKETCRLPFSDDVEEKSHTIRDDNSSPRGCSFPPRKRGRPSTFNQKSHKDPNSADVSSFFNAITRYIVNSAAPSSEDFALPFLKNSTKEDCNRLGREYVFPRPHKGRPKKRKRGARRFAPGQSMQLSTEDESLFLRQTLDNSNAIEFGQRNLSNLHQKKRDDCSGFRRHSDEILNDGNLGSRSRKTRLKQQVQETKANKVVSSSAPANKDLLPLAQRIRRLIPGYTSSDGEVFTLEEFCTLETLEEAVERAAREARSEELQESQLESNDLVSSSSKWKSRSKRSSRSPEGSYWDCSVCTYRNKAEAFKCAMCDVRKGTSTRKPRLNAQLVAQQQAQQNLSPLIHVKSVKSTPRGPAQRKAGTSKKPRPRLKNVDRSSAISTEVVVNNVPVIITEYKEKAHTRTTTSSTATTETTANRTNGSVNGL